MLDCIECELAQSLGRFVGGENANALIHTHKPLRGGTVDDRCFVAPAMRIAMADAMRGHQTVGIFQRFQNDRNCFPNMLTAKHCKLCGIGAIALHRVQDVVVFQTVRDARVEVVHAISRRAMDDTRAVICGGVVGQIHRCGACKACIDVRERVVEFDQVEFFANRSGKHFAAELPAL